MNDHYNHDDDHDNGINNDVNIKYNNVDIMTIMMLMVVFVLITACI